MLFIDRWSNGPKDTLHLIEIDPKGFNFLFISKDLTRELPIHLKYISSLSSKPHLIIVFSAYLLSMFCFCALQTRTAITFFPPDTTHKVIQYNSYLYSFSFPEIVKKPRSLLFIRYVTFCKV